MSEPVDAFDAAVARRIEADADAWAKVIPARIAYDLARLAGDPYQIGHTYAAFYAALSIHSEAARSYVGLFTASDPEAVATIEEMDRQFTPQSKEGPR
jgi:hypothetical protein